MNHVGTPSCFTIAITSYINSYQYGGEPDICLRKLGLEILDFLGLCVFVLICDAVTFWTWNFLRAILILSDTFPTVNGLNPGATCDSVVWSPGWVWSWEGLLSVMVTGVSTTWAKVIFRVKNKLSEEEILWVSGKASTVWLVIFLFVFQCYSQICLLGIELEMQALHIIDH